MNLKPLHNKFIFSFLDEIENGVFKNKTDWNFVIKSSTEITKEPRWAKVECVGPDVKSFSANEYVYIEALKWTDGVTFNGEKIWSSDEKQVLLSSKTRPYGYR